MVQRARSGRAKINARHPQAMGECDLTGFWYPLSEMRHKMEWAGNKLVDTGLLVGPDQLDKPQHQYRSVILPPDPRPVQNPRPSPHVTGYRPVFATVARPFGDGEFGTYGFAVEPRENPTGPTTPGNYGLTQLIVGGASLPPYYPLAKYRVLEMVAEITGIATPSQIIDRSVHITKQNQSIGVFGTQPTRGWVLIYNPVNPQAQVALTATAPPLAIGTLQVTWGNISNLILGPGEAFFGSVDQGLGDPYRGALSVIGLLPGMEFWAWESGAPELWLTDDYGTLITDDWGQAIPINDGWGQPETYFDRDGEILLVFNALSWPTKAPSGPGVWNDKTVVNVGPGSDPHNGFKKLIYGEVTPMELLTTGGNDLPWTEPAVRGQLWNPGGVDGGTVLIASGVPRVPRAYGTGNYGTSGYGTRPAP